MGRCPAGPRDGLQHWQNRCFHSLRSLRRIDCLMSEKSARSSLRCHLCSGERVLLDCFRNKCPHRLIWLAWKRSPKEKERSPGISTAETAEEPRLGGRYGWCSRRRANRPG